MANLRNFVSSHCQNTNEGVAATLYILKYSFIFFFSFIVSHSILWPHSIQYKLTAYFNGVCIIDNEYTHFIFARSSPSIQIQIGKWGTNNAADKNEF